MPDINDVVRAILQGQPGVRHEKTMAPMVNYHYHHRSAAKTGQWTNTYECPVCHRQTRQLANFLGNRKMLCNGIRWFKETPAQPEVVR